MDAQTSHPDDDPRQRFDARIFVRLTSEQKQAAERKAQSVGANISTITRLLLLDYVGQS